MNKTKARALAQFPSVLLTLISIIQALALELLWSKVQDSTFLWAMDSTALVAWSTVAASLLGIVLVWLVFTTMVMGLVWEPSLRDSLAPFVIGLQEFLLVSLIGESFNPYWLIVLASVFVTANWIVHFSMKRARAQEENKLFFHGLNPATPKDFLPVVAVVAILSGLGLILLAYPEQVMLTYFSLAAANIILFIQLFGTRQLWTRAMNLPDEQDVPDADR